MTKFFNLKFFRMNSEGGNTKEIYGLIGKSLSHSYSPAYFAEKFVKKHINAEYRLFEMDNIGNLRAFIKDSPELKGLNVTIPFKLNIIPFLDEIDPVAQLTGSVNTIKIDRRNDNLFLKGYNTDTLGFENTIKPLVKDKNQLKALILGTGATAHTLAYVLRKIGIYFYFVSRKPVKVESLSYSWLDKKILKAFKLIINATPLGMFPNVDQCPDIPYDYIDKKSIVYDVVYNPEETLFLKKGREKGAITKNGLEMLYRQADEAWKIWKSTPFLKKN